MRFLVAFFFLIFIFNISHSALGFKFVGSDCAPLIRISEKMRCYHEAAVTAAYMSGASTAKPICRQIWDLASGLSAEDNTREVAEIETNGCYFDVGRITGDLDACSYVQNWRGDTSSGLFGDQTQAELCIDLANKTLAVQQYHTRAQRDSLCNVVYVFAPLLIGAFYFRQK